MSRISFVRGQKTRYKSERGLLQQGLDNASCRGCAVSKKIQVDQCLGRGVGRKVQLVLDGEAGVQLAG